MQAPSAREWWQRPNRVLLINLREGDEPRIDPDRLIDEVRAFSATAFCINGGGIVACRWTVDPNRFANAAERAFSGLMQCTTSGQPSTSNA